MGSARKAESVETGAVNEPDAWIYPRLHGSGLTFVYAEALAACAAHNEQDDEESGGNYHREPIPLFKRENQDLRDYFAAKAMQMKFGPRGTSMSLDGIAKCAYEMADAMIRARTNPRGETK